MHFLVIFYGENLKVDGSCLRHFDHFPKWPRRFLLKLFSEVNNEFEGFFFEIALLIFAVTEMTQFDDLQNCNYYQGKMVNLYVKIPFSSKFALSKCQVSFRNIVTKVRESGTLF